MKKLFNFRLMPLIFLSMILASMVVYFSFYFMHYENLSSMLFGCVSCMCGISFTLIGLGAIFKDYVVKFFKKNYMYFFIVLTFFTIAMGVCFYSLDRYNKITSLYSSIIAFV